MIPTEPTPTVLLALTDIEPWDHNARSREKFTPEALGDLVDSIKRIGQLHPITVRPHPAKPGRYQIGEGQRRWAALRLTDRTQIEARVRPLDDAAMFSMVFASGGEGLTVPLSPMEEAKGYRDAIKTLGLSVRDAADFFGGERGRSHIARRLTLLHLPEIAVTALEAGELPLNVAEEIAGIADEADRLKVAQLALKDRATLGVLPLRQVKLHIQEHVHVAFRGVTFDPAEAALTAAGPCAACEFYLLPEGHARGGGGGGAARCRKPSCFREKVAAAQARLARKEAAAGKVQLKAEELAIIYPKGGLGIAHNCGFVEYAKPVPYDLVKPEVMAQGRVPAWKDLCAGEAAKVTIYLGFNQAGRAVDLVKLKEALLAADANEHAIFNTETIRRYLLERSSDAAKAERRRRQEGQAPSTAAGAAEEADDDADDAAESEAPAAAASEAESEAAQQRALIAALCGWITGALEKAHGLTPQFRLEGIDLLRRSGAPTVPQVAAAHATEAQPTNPAEWAKVTENPKIIAEWVKLSAGGKTVGDIAALYGVPEEDVADTLGVAVEPAPETPAPAPKAKAARPPRERAPKLTREEQLAKAREMRAAKATFADIFLATKLPRKVLTTLLAEIDGAKA